MNEFSHVADEAQINREKQKARELRASQWWKRRLAKGVCHYCGHRFPVKELTMDHIVPISKGGKSTRGNVAVCCKACNTKKKSMLLMEWDQYLNSV
jgi:5-methylcytosine-specific restriction endonuclease McrA